MNGVCKHIIELSWAHVGYRRAEWLNLVSSRAQMQSKRMKLTRQKTNILFLVTVSYL